MEQAPVALACPASVSVIGGSHMPCRVRARHPVMGVATGSPPSAEGVRAGNPRHVTSSSLDHSQGSRRQTPGTEARFCIHEFMYSSGPIRCVWESMVIKHPWEPVLLRHPMIFGSADVHRPCNPCACCSSIFVTCVRGGEAGDAAEGVRGRGRQCATQACGV